VDNSVSMTVPVFAGEGKLVFENRPVPGPVAPDDVLVAVRACGICGTDLNILAVPPAHKALPGVILGHEAVGRVVEVGAAVSGVGPGDRVVVAPRLTCSRCTYCRRGLANQCEDYRTIGTTMDGAFAPYVRVPERALWRVPADVADDDALLFEPLSCAVGAVARVPLRPGDRVTVIGAGPMGMLFAMLYKAMGAGKVILADVVPHRLELARQFGADRTIDAGKVSLREAVNAETGIGCDIVVDAVGNQLPAALSITRRAGHVILFGLRPHDTPAVSQYAITRNDVTIVGSFVGLNPFAQTLQLLESGLVHPGALITHRLPLTSLSIGVELMRSGQAMKVAIEM
jgi:threonine dehydrogenase-like Zn-dependent dehydrogenase